MTRRRLVAVTALLALHTTVLSGQDPGTEAPTPTRIEVEPAALDMQVGESTQLHVTVRDAEGATLDVPVLYLPFYGQFWNLEARTWGFNLFKVSKTGLVTASRPGEYRIRVRVPRSERDTTSQPVAADAGDRFLQVDVALAIRHPPVTEVAFVAPPDRLYTGTTVRLDAQITDESGATREDVPVRFASSDPDVARVDDLGYVTGTGPGAAEITAHAAAVSTRLRVTTYENPTRSLSLEASASTARTGDVVHLTATPLDEGGRTLPDVPVIYSFHARTDDLSVGGPTSGMISQDGRFVADLPGEYTIVANAGGVSDSLVLPTRSRDVRQEIELVGHGRVSDRGTSDLWVWEGPDGGSPASHLRGARGGACRPELRGGVDGPVPGARRGAGARGVLRPQLVSLS